MIIDGFMIYNEMDILRIRLEELYPVVDKFVIVQGWHNFRGVGRNIDTMFHVSDEQWAPYRDKIVTFNYGLSGGNTTWDREHYLRDMIRQVALDEVTSDDDLIIVSDADEIPRREAVAKIRSGETVVNGSARLKQKIYYYALNCRNTGGFEIACKIATAKVLKTMTASELRRTDPEVIEDAGWHFSYLGDADWIRNKLRSFSHTELDNPEVLGGIEQAMAERKDPFGRTNVLYSIETIDESWPVAVKNNPEYWRKFTWEK